MTIKDMFNFTASKSKNRKILENVYFENGNVIATSGRVCLKVNMEYPSNYEKTLRNKKLELADKDYVFPNYNNLFRDPIKNDYIESTIDINFLKRALDFYNINKDKLSHKLFEVQLRIDTNRCYYLGMDVVKSIIKYLSFYPNVVLYIPINRLATTLQLETYKKEESIFDDGSNTLESSFVFISDRLLKSDQVIYTSDDKVYVDNDYDYNKFEHIDRSYLENSGYLDLDFMNTYFTKYNLPSASEFKSGLLSSMSHGDVLNIIEFDDYLHRVYGDYDKGDNAKSMEDMFKELFGDDARLIASFFGVDKDNL